MGKTLKSAFRRIFWSLSFAWLAACAGTGAPGGGDLGLTRSTDALEAAGSNAAEPLSAGYPAPIADTWGCPADMCLGIAVAKPQLECHHADDSYQMRLQGFVVPHPLRPLQNFTGRILRIVDPQRGQFLDTLVSGDVQQAVSGHIENRSGSFETVVRASLPPELKYFLLSPDAPFVTAETPQHCSADLCAPPQAYALVILPYPRSEAAPVSVAMPDKLGGDDPRGKDLWKPAPSEAKLLPLVPSCEMDLGLQYLR